MFQNEKILVAGAGGLLGSALVAALEEAGASVVAVDISLNSMRHRLESAGVKLEGSDIKCVECDVNDTEQVAALFADGCGLTGAVNATYPRNKTYGAHFFDVTLSSFNENLSLHLGSAFLFSQQCAAYFKRTRSPFSLVNVSSIYGVVAPKFEVYEGTRMTMPVEYSAIKAAIIHLGKYIAAYVNDSRFRVNCVSPGGILDRQPDEFLKAYKKHTHGKGMLDVNDVVGSVLFLLSDSAKCITGQNIVIDDGFSL